MQVNHTPSNLKTLVIAMGFGLLALQPDLVGAQTYDFKTSVETTLAQNPQREVSSARIEQAQAAVKQASNSRLPQLNLSFTVSRSDNPLNVFGMKLQQRQASFADFGFKDMGQAMSGNYAYQPKDLNEPGSHTDYNTRIEMLLPIWNGGKIAGYKQQAQAMLAAAKDGDIAVQQMLTFYVYEAYEGVHASRSFIQVAEQALKASEAYITTTKNLVEQGIVVRSELLSAQAHHAEVELMLEQAKNHELLALDGLRSLMGLDPTADLDVSNRVNISLPTDDLNQLTQMALSFNPQLQAMRNQTYASQAAAKVVKSDMYPSVNFMARNDWNDDNLGLGESSYTLAAVAKWKVTDFGVTGRAVDRANAETKEAQAATKAKEQEIRLELLKAWREYQTSQKKVASNKAAVEYAEEAQGLIARRYETGVATMTEVLASQTQLDKARAELVNAEYSANIHKAQLRLATGQMSLEQIQN